MLSKSKREKKIIVIVGPTASGKSSLALRLAQEWNGEIVSADSRQIYRDMDIGTNKPARAELRAVRHHLINIINPDHVCTLAEWQQRACQALDAILRRGKLPILAGGTGLYISSIVDNYQIPRGRGPSKYQHLILGLNPPRTELYERINARVLNMVSMGLEREVLELSKKYSWKLPSMHGIGYREWKQYFDGKTTRQETIQKIQQATRNFAKRQMTWFRMIERDHPIHWLNGDASGRVRAFLTP